jgi:hypothetical protein
MGQRMIVYEVYRNTPEGDFTMARYSSLEEAEKHMDAWNAGENGKPRYSLDKARICVCTVFNKFEGLK